MQTAQVVELKPRTPAPKSAMGLQQVPLQHVEAVLPHVLKWLLTVVERSGRRYTMPVLAGLLIRGDLQLWLIGDDAPRGIVVTELYIAPSGLKFASIRAAAGEGHEGWIHLISELEDWARAEGCAGIDALARKGWARRLKDYRLTHVWLEKDLR